MTATMLSWEDKTIQRPKSDSRPLRAVLVFPPSLYKNYTPPVNIGYIGAMMLLKGMDVKVIDASAINNDIPVDEIVRQCVELDPDIVGITMNVLFIKPAYELGRKLKEKGIKVLGGGPHPSIVPEEPIIHGGADIVVYGEGENTVAEIADYLRGERKLEEITGIAYRDKNGYPVTNPARAQVQDLDEFPFPAREIFVREHYTGGTEYYQAHGGMFTSRGCPATCTYCNLSVYGRRVRVRSAQDIFNEMKFLKQNYGVTAFEYLDDTFSAKFARIEELCHLIINDDEMRGIKWQANTRLDFANQDLLELMARSGCFRLFWGLESGDEATLKKVAKKQEVDKAVQTLTWAHEVGIKSICGMMFAFPWDTPQNTMNTVELIRRLEDVVEEFNPLGLLVPVPGTPIYDEYCAKGELKEWWLSDNFGHLYRSNTYFPFFRRRFYNDFALLEDGFFEFDAATKKTIYYATNVIGWHNITRNNPPYKAAALLAAVYVSKVLYAIHPTLEGIVFDKISKLKRKFFGHNVQSWQSEERKLHSMAELTRAGAA